MVNLLNHMPIFEWYFARLVVENGHQKEMCYSEVMKEEGSVKSLQDKNHVHSCRTKSNRINLQSCSSFHFIS